MLDPSWALTRPLLWLAIALLLAVLAIRAIRRDRREYQRFKRYRMTSRRQAMFRKWLRGSFLVFGGLALAVGLLAGAFIAPLAAELAAWPAVRVLRDLAASGNVFFWGGLIGAVIAAVVLTVVGVRAVKAEGDGIVSVGDIQAMLPRNRQELRLGALLSINAGVVEEALFRLALPAAIYGASGSALAAVVASVLLFGALHAYQGVAGVIGTTLIGTLMMLVYAVTGSIVAPMVLHALFDLRSLVLIPVAVMGVHRVDGRQSSGQQAGQPARGHQAGSSGS